MIIVDNKTKITKGEGHQLIKRFDKEGQVETMKGFLGLEVLFTENLADYDEVTISTRWASKEAFKAWTSSESFKASHKHEGGRPDYIISNEILYYDVKVTRDPIAIA